MSFLNSLDQAEQAAFISVAEKQTFPRGARIMEEGAEADHVIVILAGWTRITVHENGGDRVIAERGPGQLVGERSALQKSVRSASVTALGTVQALVMPTEDFASFVDAHPRVLDIVERQIYDRLVEPAEQARLNRAEFRVLEPRIARVPVPRPSQLSGENCTVLLTDVVGFGAPNRSDPDRLLVRQAGRDMLKAALGDFWDGCVIEDRGDGLLVVAPPHIPTAVLMAGLHRVLPARLRRHNYTYSEPMRFQLRVAANVGPVVSDDIGMSGEAIIRTARLVECPAIKRAMAESGATLGIIVSEFVYETAIRHSADWVNAAAYKPVRAKLKELSIPGWLQLFDLTEPGHGHPLTA